MAEQQYCHFIGRIIELTKRNELAWYYLDQNKELYEGMGWIKEVISWGSLVGNKQEYGIAFSKDNSFYCTIDNMAIVLLVRNQSPVELYIVPDTYRNELHLGADEYGEYITRLHNLVLSRFPTAKAFVDKFMSQQQLIK